MEKEPIILEPVFKSLIWGGTRLRDDFGYDIPSETTGECWAISAHEHGDCIVANGEFKGMKLSEVWAQHPELFGVDTGGKFPLLVKIIDAKEDLSIQVHPDDKYAKENENGALGKTECWYVLDALEGTEIVIGHNAATKEEMCEMIDGKRWDEFIRKVPVKKGDFFQIEPGTLHAIKGGTLILETQQNSDVTYRVYDYDRLSDGKPRELHLEKSKEVIVCPFVETDPAKTASGMETLLDRILADGAEGNTDGVKVCDQHAYMASYVGLGKFKHLVKCDYYSVYHVKSHGKGYLGGNYPFLMASVIDGEGTVGSLNVRKGTHFIVPNGAGTFEIDGDMELIISHI